MSKFSLPEFQANAEQIPFLLNGTLDAAARDKLRAAVAIEPALAAELELQRRIRDAVVQSAAVPQRSSLPLFLNRLAAESQREVNQTASNVMPLQRTVAALSPIASQPRTWKIAFALAASVVVVQAALLAPLLRQENVTLEPLSGAGSHAAAANLQLTFKPEATEKQIREILRASGVEIVAGPSALGVYQARGADPTRASAALQAQSAVVESATALK